MVPPRCLSLLRYFVLRRLLFTRACSPYNTIPEGTKRLFLLFSFKSSSFTNGLTEKFNVFYTFQCFFTLLTMAVGIAMVQQFVHYSYGLRVGFPLPYRKCPSFSSSAKKSNRFWKSSTQLRALHLITHPFQRCHWHKKCSNICANLR